MPGKARRRRAPGLYSSRLPQKVLAARCRNLLHQKGENFGGDRRPALAGPLPQSFIQIARHVFDE